MKFYVEERGKRLLRAANPHYDDITLNGQHRIIGHVVQILKEPPKLQDYNEFLISKTAADESWQRVIVTALKHGLTGRQIESMIDIFSHMV